MGVLVFPTVVAVVACVAAYLLGGVTALFTVVLLAILETTLSFDNAVINARVLQRMTPVWQKRFLSWGIPIAVVGVRFLLPLIIVAIAAKLNPFLVAQLALFDPAEYGVHLESAHIPIAAFGSAFLLLVAFKFFFDEAKTVHWIGFVERRLAAWGGIAAIEIALVSVIGITAALLSGPHAATVAVAGAIGIVTFIAIESVTEFFDVRAASAGLALFVYLNVLDSAFSLDEVIAAFAVTTNVLSIVAGLGIGALFVRAFTVMLVRAKTLQTLPYIEHGAHWAILGLALAMLGGMFVHIPEPFTGFVGLVFVVFAYTSSRREVRKVAR